MAPFYIAPKLSSLGGFTVVARTYLSRTLVLLNNIVGVTLWPEGTVPLIYMYIT